MSLGCSTPEVNAGGGEVRGVTALELGKHQQQAFSPEASVQPAAHAAVPGGAWRHRYTTSARAGVTVCHSKAAEQEHFSLSCNRWGFGKVIICWFARSRASPSGRLSP